MALREDVNGSPGSSSPIEQHPKGITHAFDMEDGESSPSHGIFQSTANDQRDMGRMGKTQELRVCERCPVVDRG